MTEHPELTCEECGGPNIQSWFVRPLVWSTVMGDDTGMIVCPQCFVARYNSVVGGWGTWELATPNRLDDL